jgi:cell division protein FtsL
VFIVLNLCSLVSVGIISWWLTGSWVSCVLVIFVDLYLLTLMNFYTHFIANDYNVLQNIEETNMKVRQHNLRMDNLRKEISDARNKIASG